MENSDQFKTIPYFARDDESFEARYDPLFYLDDGDELRTGRHVSWKTVEKHYVETTKKGDDALITLDFLKQLYVISKVNETIKDFESSNVSRSQAMSYAFMSVDVGTTIEDRSFVEDIYSKRQVVIQRFKDMVKINLKQQASSKKLQRSWNDVQKRFQSSDYEYTKISYEYAMINNPDPIVTELMVFDSVKLNGTVLGCVYRDIVKFTENNAGARPLSSVSPSSIDGRIKEIIMADNDKPSSDVKIIIAPFHSKDTVGRMNASQTQEQLRPKIVKVRVSKETVTFIFETYVKHDLSQLILVKRVISDTISRIVSINRGQTLPFRGDKNFYSGSYTANISVPLSILKEVITNDVVVRKICYMNESIIVNSKTSSLNIYIRKDVFASGSIDADISIGLFERSSKTTMFVKFKKIPGTANRDVVCKLIVETVDKLLQYASDKTDDVVAYYSDYVDDFRFVKPSEPQRRSVVITAKRSNLMHLKAMAPQVFLANYTRLCSKPPTVFESAAPSEAEERSDQTTMKFPMYGESKPLMYKCVDPNYPYPGLIKNTVLDNQKVFPYLPCCYQKPQTQSRSYMDYFNRAKRSKVERINSDEISKTTTKIVSPRRLGALPPRIDKLLHYATGVKFYRYGTHRSPSSCLTVLNMVTRRVETDKRVREALTKRRLLSGGDSVERLRNPTSYVDPKALKPLLEEYYGISYVLFSMTDDDFAEVDTSTSLKSNTVFMIENSELQHVELIIDEDTLKYVNKKYETPVFVFDSSEDVVQKIISRLKERFEHSLFDNRTSQVTTRMLETTSSPNAEPKKTDGRVGFVGAFRHMKRLALYVMWSACHAYAKHIKTVHIGVDDWIAERTTIVDGHSYRNVTIGPIYDVSELMTTDNLFIFDSVATQKRVAFNMKLLSPDDLDACSKGNYVLYYRSRFDFDVPYPTSLALSKKEYFQRTRRPYKLNMLIDSSVRFLEHDKLYFAERLFDTFFQIRCIFYGSIQDLINGSFLMGSTPVILNETPLILTTFEPSDDNGPTVVSKYSLNVNDDGVGPEPVDIMLIVNNNVKFYGLVLP